MAERSSLTQAIQIGIETTPGTPVAATKRLSALGIAPSITVTNATFRPTGSKFNAVSALGKEWTTSALSGSATYTELIYALASVIGNANVVNTANVYTWGFTANPYTSDNVQTYTIEHGSSVRADQFSYGLITEFNMTFNRENVSLGGSMMGRAIVDGFSMTSAASVTALPLVPVIPTQVSVYLDNEGGSFGTTKLTRMISTEFAMAARFAPLWVLDAANPSYVTHIETAPDSHVAMTLEADAQGMGLLNNLRAGDVHLLRIRAIGANIAGGSTPFSLTIDQKILITATGGFSDASGVYAIEFTGTSVYTGTGTNPSYGGSTANSALGITIVNNIASL